MADVENLDIRMAGKRSDDSVKPCPFCGSEAYTRVRVDTVLMTITLIVTCGTCGVEKRFTANKYNLTFDTVLEAVQKVINAWNRRDTITECKKEEK